MPIDGIGGGGMPAISGGFGGGMNAGMAQPAMGADNGPGSMRNMFAADTFQCAPGGGGGWGAKGGSQAASQGGGGAGGAGEPEDKEKDKWKQLIEAFFQMASKFRQAAFS